MSASLNKDKEVVGENSDAEPTMLSNLTRALGRFSVKSCFQLTLKIGHKELLNPYPKIIGLIL